VIPGFEEEGYSVWLTPESKFTDTLEAALSRALKYLQRQWVEACAQLNLRTGSKSERLEAFVC